LSIAKDSAMHQIDFTKKNFTLRKQIFLIIIVKKDRKIEEEEEEDTDNKWPFPGHKECLLQ
jgi:hypothetical protein